MSREVRYWFIRHDRMPSAADNDRAFDVNYRENKRVSSWNEKWRRHKEISAIYIKKNMRANSTDGLLNLILRLWWIIRLLLLLRWVIRRRSVPILILRRAVWLIIITWIHRLSIRILLILLWRPLRCHLWWFFSATHCVTTNNNSNNRNKY